MINEVLPLKSVFGRQGEFEKRKSIIIQYSTGNLKLMMEVITDNTLYEYMLIILHTSNKMYTATKVCSSFLLLYLSASRWRGAGVTSGWGVWLLALGLCPGAHVAG